MCCWYSLKTVRRTKKLLYWRQSKWNATNILYYNSNSTPIICTSFGLFCCTLSLALYCSSQKWQKLVCCMLFFIIIRYLIAIDRHRAPVSFWRHDICEFFCCFFEILIIFDWLPIVTNPNCWETNNLICQYEDIQDMVNNCFLSIKKDEWTPNLLDDVYLWPKDSCLRFPLLYVHQWYSVCCAGSLFIDGKHAMHLVHYTCVSIGEIKTLMEQ